MAQPMELGPIPSPAGGPPLDGLPLDGMPIEGLPLDAMPLEGMDAELPVEPQSVEIELAASQARESALMELLQAIYKGDDLDAILSAIRP